MRIISAMLSYQMVTMRGIWTLIICLYIYGVFDNMTAFDVSKIGIPEDYLFIIGVFAIVAGILGALYVRCSSHYKAGKKLVESGELSSPYQLKYDIKYEVATFIGFVVGTFVAVCLTPAVVNYCFVGAGQWTYAIVAGALALIIVPVAVCLLHDGVRVFIAHLMEKMKELAQALADAKKSLEETKQILDDAGITEDIEKAVATATTSEAKTSGTPENTTIRG